jgi:nucleoside-diphosphate-sugar epimerase
MVGDEYLLKNASKIEELVILRPSTVYGAEMRNQSLFKLIKSIYCYYFFFIGQIGSCFNIIHVDDVVSALQICAKNPIIPSRIYNLSLCCRVEEFVRIVKENLGLRHGLVVRLPFWLANALASIGTLVSSKFPLSKSRVIALSSNTVFSAELISSELGFYPSITNEKGIKELTFSWLLRYKNNLSS